MYPLHSEYTRLLLHAVDSLLSLLLLSLSFLLSSLLLLLLLLLPWIKPLLFFLVQQKWVWSILEHLSHLVLIWLGYIHQWYWRLKSYDSSIRSLTLLRLSWERPDKWLPGLYIYWIIQVPGKKPFISAVNSETQNAKDLTVLCYDETFGIYIYKKLANTFDLVNLVLSK